jgi:hypothetical protein
VTAPGADAAALRAARAAVKEGAARMLGVLRHHAGEAGMRERKGIGAPRSWPLRWCLLAEALAEAFESLPDPRPTRAARPEAGGVLKLWWSRATDRWQADPFWDRLIDPQGLVVPEESQRLRIGSAAAAFLGTLEREAARGFPPAVPHAAFGMISAADWAGLLLVFASDAERRILRATV